MFLLMIQIFDGVKLILELEKLYSIQTILSHFLIEGIKGSINFL